MVGRLGAWSGCHPLAVDSALAAITLVATVAPMAPSSMLLLFLLVLAFVAMAVRRVRPLASVAGVLVAALGVLALIVGSQGVQTSPSLPIGVPVLVAVYSAAAHGPRWARAAALGVALVGAVAVSAARFLRPSQLRAVTASDLAEPAGLAGIIGILVLLAWTAGQWRRTRVAYLASASERARREVHVREQQDAIAAAAERARIAREMHDVVAHSLLVIITQADGGRYAATSTPQVAVRALETIATTGRAALNDMRQLLGVLHEGRDADLAPQPDATSIPDLVAAVRSSGLPVTLVSTGVERELPPGAGLAVYRTVQEALSNVLKHGGPAAHAQVRLAWSSASVAVHVEDDGRGATAPGDGGGRGLSGMRERLALYDGAVEAGPRAGGGFAVDAVLPWPKRPS